MSYKLFEEENISNRIFIVVLSFLNRVSFLYFRIVRLKTIEMYEV
jgi:hypothetical protein